MTVSSVIDKGLTYYSNKLFQHKHLHYNADSTWTVFKKH